MDREDVAKIAYLAWMRAWRVGRDAITPWEQTDERTKQAWRDVIDALREGEDDAA